MNEAEKSDEAERRKRAEARLTRARPARGAAAAAHASRMRPPMHAGVREPADASSTPDQSPALSRLEAKVLDAASEILVAGGGEGRRIAELIRDFIDARAAR